MRQVLVKPLRHRTAQLDGFGEETIVNSEHVVVIALPGTLLEEVLQYPGMEKQGFETGTLVGMATAVPLWPFRKQRCELPHLMQHARVNGSIYLLGSRPKTVSRHGSRPTPYAVRRLKPPLIRYATSCRGSTLAGVCTSVILAVAHAIAATKPYPAANSRSRRKREAITRMRAGSGC